MQDWQTVRAHACFRLDIRFPIGNSAKLSGGESALLELWQSMSYRIMRSPDDLLAHTRRVRLCQEPALQGKLAGALGDLGYVLGDRGASLQHRLRAEAQSILADPTVLDSALSSVHSIHAAADGRVLPTLTQLLRLKEAEGAATSP